QNNFHYVEVLNRDREPNHLTIRSFVHPSGNPASYHSARKNFPVTERFDRLADLAFFLGQSDAGPFANRLRTNNSPEGGNPGTGENRITFNTLHAACYMRIKVCYQSVVILQIA